MPRGSDSSPERPRPFARVCPLTEGLAAGDPARDDASTAVPISPARRRSPSLTANRGVVMLAVTESAIDAIKRLAPEEGGLRVFTSELPGAAGPALQAEVSQEPAPQDQVLEADGVQVFLEPSAATLLDDKVLDATLEGTSVRFAVAEQS